MLLNQQLMSENSDFQKRSSLHATSKMNTIEYFLPGWQQPLPALIPWSHQRV